MANDDLKEVFRSKQKYIIDTNCLDMGVMDVLLSKNIISQCDYDSLRQVEAVPAKFNRDAMSLLNKSSNPQTFIHLRLALLDKYWVIEQIDKELPTPTSRLHQPELGQSTNGKLLS